MYTDWEWLLAGMDRVWRPVATPLGLFLAVMVTGHVLLHKRDVAASIGWIGLAWLAPVWGALLYLMFGINRVARRARRIRGPRPPRHHAVRLPQDDFAGSLKPLERAVRRITNRPAADHNGVAVLLNGDEAYPAMLAAIDAARRSVALSTYIMRNDVVGRRFLEALDAARRRGVEVRILLDGIGSGYLPRIYFVLRRRGLPVALFMHSVLPWRMPFLNLRSHKKLLVVDGSVGFTGGMNITAESLLASTPTYPVADIHFSFEGPIVTQLMDAFARDWVFTAGETLDSEAWFPEPSEAGDCVCRVISSGPDEDFEKIQMVLLEAISTAASSIKLMTPYFLPDDQVVTALALAAMRGVDVELVVPRRSNHRFVDLAMRGHIAPLIEHGVHVWFAKRPFNHAKLMTVDGHWCLVGSANWDMRSLRLNFELDVEIYSGDLARQLEALMRSHQHARLRLQDLEGRSLPVRLRDAALRLFLPYI